jgi:predicted nucleic acid-binding protein
MLVVSDTSPVLNLAIIGRLDLLHQQFGKVWLPQAVTDELRIEQDLPGSAAVRAPRNKLGGSPLSM